MSTFISLTNHKGSIGRAMRNAHLIEKFRREAAKKNGMTPIQVVDTYIKKRNLSTRVLNKFEEYRENISKMDYSGAIRYTANFYKKGLATYVPKGCI